MSTLTQLRPRGRWGRGLLALGAVMTMAAGTMTVTSSAHAESGRRICEYSFKAEPKNTNSHNPRQKNPLLHVSIGMDYKKDGACPSLDPNKLAATGFVDVDQVNPKNPVNKWTCEDWGRTHQTYLAGLGSDPCPALWNDQVYAFIWQDPTTSNPAAPSLVQLGYYQQYQ